MVLNDSVPAEKEIDILSNKKSLFILLIQFIASIKGAPLLSGENNIERRILSLIRGNKYITRNEPAKNIGVSIDIIADYKITESGNNRESTRKFLSCS